MTESTVQVCVLDDVGHINLRGDRHSVDFMTAVEFVIGQSLPVAANTMSEKEHRVFWIGPDEWLITTVADNTLGLLADLDKKLASHHAAVNDVSGGNIELRLSGKNVRDVLAKGCTLDFYENVFGPGTCAQSGLAKAVVLFGFVDAPHTFEIIVRRSFSDYLLRWLANAGCEYGIEFR